MIVKVHGPWASRISSGGGGRGWLQSVPDRKKKGQIHGDRKVRDGSLNDFLFYVVLKNFLLFMYSGAVLLHN